MIPNTYMGESVNFLFIYSQMFPIFKGKLSRNLPLQD